MICNFKELEASVFSHGYTPRILLVNAHDQFSLSALVVAKQKGIISAMLLGEQDKIISMLEHMGECVAEYEIIDHTGDDLSAAQLAMSLIKSGKADIPMKGLMQTSAFMKAILDKQNGFVQEGAVLSQATLLELEKENRFVILTDCAVNISPPLSIKKEIAKNAVLFAKTIGIVKPKVALIAPLEVVNHNIPATVDAQAVACSLTEWNEDCIAEGPLALDIAVSPQAAHHKGMDGCIQGDADILIMPDLCTGNALTKSLVYYANLSTASALLGCTRPVVMTSRTDLPENKYLTILLAVSQLTP